MKILLVLLYLFASSVSVARAEIVHIKDSPGGLIDEFLDRYARISQYDRVVIEGYCMSACTLVTHFVPRGQACVAPGTVFGFHSAFYELGKKEIYDKGATSDMWKLYPYRVQKMIRAKGWNGITKHPNLVIIPGSAIYPTCP